MLKARNTHVKETNKPKTSLNLTELKGIFHAQEIQRKQQELIQILLNKVGKTTCPPVKARKIWGKDTISLSKKIVEMREGIASLALAMTPFCHCEER